MVESYLPLLQVFERLTLRGISPKVTVGLTPVLLEQFADPRFALGFLAYVEQKAQAAREDRRAFQADNQPHLARLAGLWEEWYRRAAIFFRRDLRSDVIGAWRRLHRKGHVEIIASAATHA